MYQARARLWLVGAVALLGGTVGAIAQPASVEELEGRLVGQVGVERARTLAELTDRLKGDSPGKAADYGRQALELFEEHPDPASELLTLNEMAWAFLMLGEHEAAIEYGERGRALAEEIGDPLGLSRSLNNLGVVARRRGEPAAAIDIFRQSLEIREELGAEAQVAGSMNNLGVVYGLDLGDYERSLEFHVEALKIRERLGDRREIALSFSNIGAVYHRLGDLERALEFHQRALEIRRDLGIQFRIASTLIYIGQIYVDSGAYERALGPLREAIEISLSTGERSKLALALVYAACAYSGSGRQDEGLRSAERAVELSVETGERLPQIESLLALAKIQRQLERFPEAEQNARRALELSEEMSAQFVRRCHLEISEILKAAGDYQGALEAFESFKQVSDEVFDQASARRIEVLEVQFETERRQQEISRLEDERILQELKLGNQVLQRNVILASALVLGTFGVLGYRRRLRTNRQLEELSFRDQLTGLRNRRFLLQTIEADLAVSEREHRAAAAVGREPQAADLVLLQVDIDHFKSVNDAHGHAVGDAFLQEIAAKLKATCRTSDTLVRWGGEEFLVLARFIDRSEAARLAERIRAAIEDLPLVIASGRTIRRTCSIGFAPYPFLSSQPDGLTWEQVLDLADRATYVAKASGRNAWVGLAPTSSASAAPDMDDGLERLRKGQIAECVEEGWLEIEASVAPDTLRWQER